MATSAGREGQLGEGRRQITSCTFSSSVHGSSLLIFPHEPSHRIAITGANISTVYNEQRFDASFVIDFPDVRSAPSKPLSRSGFSCGLIAARDTNCCTAEGKAGTTAQRYTFSISYLFSFGQRVLLGCRNAHPPTPLPSLQSEDEMTDGLT